MCALWKTSIFKYPNTKIENSLRKIKIGVSLCSAVVSHTVSVFGQARQALYEWRTVE